jgi:spermidine synthase
MRPSARAYALILCGLLASAVAAAAERILLERKSSFNTILVTENERGLRILRFEAGGALQSVVKPGDPDHLELAYARAIPVAFLYVEKPSRVLVVGLGGGTIPGFLRRRFPDTQVDVVEIDPGVVEVAKSHFGFREDAKMRVHVDDGRRFIERAAGTYDIIFLDGFGIDSVPRHLTTREFHHAVRRALTDRGIVVGNLWGRAVNRLYDSMVKTYQAVYDDLSIVDVPASANKIVVGFPYIPGIAPTEIHRRARALTRDLALRTDLAEIVERGHRSVGSDGGSAEVLTDDGATQK